MLNARLDRSHSWCGGSRKWVGADCGRRVTGRGDGSMVLDSRSPRAVQLRCFPGLCGDRYATTVRSRSHGACPLTFTALLLAPRAARPVSVSSSCAVEDLSCRTQRRDIAIPCDVRGTHYAWKVDLFPLIQTLKIFLLCGLNMVVCQVSSLNACLLLSNSFQNF